MMMPSRSAARRLKRRLKAWRLIPGSTGRFTKKECIPRPWSIGRQNMPLAGQPEVVEALDRGYAEAGYARAMVLAAEKLVARSRTAYVAPFNIAALYGNAGKTNEALAWLEKAYDARDPNMHGIHVVPAFINLRSEPRFKELLRRMNLPQN